MDWVRQSNVSRMTSYSLLPYVDEIELSKHNKVTDCWILLYDMVFLIKRNGSYVIFKVYDITRYMEFHPGGVDELMRAAGTDATELFNKIHMWVNYRSMLKSCIIGPFSGNRSNCKRH